MDQKAKVGGITLSALILWVLSVWGYAMSAKDLALTLFSLPIAEVFFILGVISIIVFSFGVSWISLQAWGSWQRKKQAKKKAKFKSDYVSIPQALHIITGEDYSSFLAFDTVREKYLHATIIIRDQAKAGNIVLMGQKTRVSSPQEIERSVFLNGAIFHNITTYSALDVQITYSSSDDPIYYKVFMSIDDVHTIKKREWNR